VRESGVERLVEDILGMVVVSTPISVGKRGSILALAGKFLEEILRDPVHGPSRRERRWVRRGGAHVY
jgi:hypothetical protein